MNSPQETKKELVENFPFPEGTINFVRNDEGEITTIVGMSPTTLEEGEGDLVESVYWDE